MKYILVGRTVWEVDEENQRVCLLPKAKHGWMPFADGSLKDCTVDIEIEYWKSQGYSKAKEITREEALITLL